MCGFGGSDNNWVLIGLMVAEILMGGLIGGIDWLCIGNPVYKTFTTFYLNKCV